jgi:ABC-type antimicrobial peptide transport system permease subunit
MAILRTNGFSAFSLMGYISAQAVAVTVLGTLLGGLFSFFFTTAVKLTVPSFTIVPRLEVQTALSSLGWIGLLLLAGSLSPAWWLSRLNLAQLLRSE